MLSSRDKNISTTLNQIWKMINLANRFYFHEINFARSSNGATLDKLKYITLNRKVKLVLSYLKMKFALWDQNLCWLDVILSLKNLIQRQKSWFHSIRQICRVWLNYGKKRNRKSNSKKLCFNLDVWEWNRCNNKINTTKSKKLWPRQKITKLFTKF